MAVQTESISTCWLRLFKFRIILKDPSFFSVTKMGERYSPISCLQGTITPLSSSFWIYASIISESVMLYFFIFGNWYYVNSKRNVDSEKSEPHMRFQPTTLHDLVGCSNHWATGDSVVSKGQVVGITGPRRVPWPSVVQLYPSGARIFASLRALSFCMEKPGRTWG